MAAEASVKQGAQRAGALLEADPYPLSFRTLEPTPASPRRLLVLLHGVGGDELQLVALGTGLIDTLVVLPRAPRSLPGARLGWFHEHLAEDGPHAGVAEARESRSKLLDLMGRLQQRHDIAPDCSVVAGFSQGGELACSAALHEPARFGGFAVLSGRLVHELRDDTAPQASLRRLDALLLHGSSDEVLVPDCARAAATRLGELGVRHQLVFDAVGHELSPSICNAFRSWYCDAARVWNANESLG